MIKKGKWQINDILLYIMFTEIILGGLGRLFGLPVRMCLFGIGLLVAILFYYKNNIKFSKRTLWYIGAIFCFILYGAIIGIVNGNSLKDIVSNLNVFISILYAFIFIVFINGDKKKIINLINLFIVYNVAIALIIFLVFVWSNYAIRIGLNPVAYLEKFERITHYGLITGLLYSNQYARVYIANGILMQVALALCLVKVAYINKKDFKDILVKSVYILILLIGIFATGTRGYWVGTIVVVILTPFFMQIANKKKFIFKIVIMCVCLSLGYVTLNQNGNSILNEIVGRVQSTTQFNQKEPSNNIRSIQTRHLLRGIKKHIVIGSGFGARINEYEVETGRSGLDFELYYLELWYKTGLLGMLFLGFGFVHIIYTTYKIIRRNNEIVEQCTLKGWGIGLVSVSVASTTNPYFAGSHGFFIPVFLIILMELFERIE